MLTEKVSRHRVQISGRYGSVFSALFMNRIMTFHSQRNAFSSITCESPLQRIPTPLGAGSSGRSGWTPFSKSSGGADDGSRAADGDDPFGLCRFTPTHSLFIGFDGMDAGLGGVGVGGGYWTPTPPMGSDHSLSRHGRFAGSPAGGGGVTEAPAKVAQETQTHPAVAVGTVEACRRSSRPPVPSHRAASGEFTGFDLDRSTKQTEGKGAAGASSHQQVLRCFVFYPVAGALTDVCYADRCLGFGDPWPMCRLGW